MNQARLRLLRRWATYLVAVHEIQQHRRIDLRTRLSGPSDPLRLMQLRLMLQGAVPIGILDLQRRGGPSEQDYAWLREVAIERLAVDTDALLCGGIRDETQKQGVAGVLCRTVAILAFQPGGVEIFDLVFVAGGAA